MDCGGGECIDFADSLGWVSCGFWELFFGFSGLADEADSGVEWLFC